MTEASRPRDQVIVCKGQRNFERIWIWFVISLRPGVFRAGGQGGRPGLGVPEADRLPRRAPSGSWIDRSRLMSIGISSVIPQMTWSASARRRAEMSSSSKSARAERNLPSA